MGLTPHHATQAASICNNRRSNRSALNVLLTSSPRSATREVPATNERGEIVPTAIAGEHPLTLYLDKRELVTLMTLGQSPEMLAIGYLRNQRIVRAPNELAAVQVDWETDSCAITTIHIAEGRSCWEVGELEAKMGKKTVTTGCGQGTVFGDLMEEIDEIKLPAHAKLTEATLYAVLEHARKQESIYKQAGAVHGCALCDAHGNILTFVEDVGRHNAVDAIAGEMWIKGWAGDDKLFYTTGRLTSEMVIKCAQMGIPFLLSRSGLTQMGYELAQRVGMTMIGRCQGKHYLLFTGAERFSK